MQLIAYGKTMLHRFKPTPARHSRGPKLWMIMKLTVILLTVACLQTSSKTWGQKINLNEKNKSLENVFKEITRQTGYVFFYTDKLLKNAGKVSVIAKDATLEQTLDMCFAEKPIAYSIVGNTIVLKVKKLPINVEQFFMEPPPPPVEIKGTVTNERGEPLASATITEKGTNNSVKTKEDGSFIINASAANAVLVISYVGYQTKEFPLNNQTNISMALVQTDVSLGDLVVTGYGTQRKRLVTSAISTVNAEDINAVQITGLDQALQGRMAGVQVTQNTGEPGGNISVKIRGVGSFSAGTEPLYIVDGVPMILTTGSLNSINPNDIERIDVLKDAASAAIYGSRATNGVVLITTKQGKNGKLLINLDAYVGAQSAAKKIDLLNGPQFAMLANENLVNGGQTPNPAWTNPASLPTHNWQDAVFRNATFQNYNISAQGGGERLRNYFSLGYQNQDGILLSSHYKRYTGRMNSEFDVTKRFKIGGTLNYSNDNKSHPLTNSLDKGILTNAIRLMPVNPVYSNADGPIDANLYGYQGYALIGASANPLYFPKSINNQVFTDVVHYKRNLKTSNIQVSTFGQYEIINGLKFKTAINYAKSNSVFWFSRLGEPAVISGFGQLIEASQYSETWRQFDQWNWTNTLSYEKQIGMHNFSIVAGTDALKNIYKEISVNGSGNPNGQYNLNSLASSASRGFTEDYELFSYLARVTYDFAGKYLLTANFRRDGSSRFGPQNKYGNFPSASIGWRLSEESFLENSNQINELKLRASYGVVGNQNIGNFKYANSYSSDAGLYNYVLGTGSQTVIPAVYRDNIGNSEIHWEKSTQLNVGLDATLFNNTITFSGDYYIKKIEDILGNAPIPSYLGVTGNSILRNEFSMENKGFEFLLGFNKNIGAVRFSSSLNFSTLDNKVTKLLGKSTDYLIRALGGLGGDDGGSQTRSQINERIGSFWGYVADGIIQDAAEAAASGMSGVKPGDRKFKDLNKDGKIDANDKTIIGNGLPKYIYGLNLNANYKNFDFTVFFQGQGGVEIANMLKGYSMNVGNNTGLINGSTEWLNRWTDKGSTNEFPRNSYQAPSSNIWFSSYYIEKGDFLRIRNLQLGYTLPDDVLKKAGLNSVRIYVAAQNLFTFTKYSGWDPEVGSLLITPGGDQTEASDFSDPLRTGVDYGRYPSPRIFSIGINMKL